MADKSFFASAALSGIQPRSVHAGTQAVYSVYTMTVTPSVSTLIRLCKIPDGARVTNWNLKMPVLGGGAFSLGPESDKQAFITSLTSSTTAYTVNPWSTVTVAGAPGVGTVYDRSSSETAQFTFIDLIFNSTGSAVASAGTIQFMCEYYMDDDE